MKRSKAEFEQKLKEFFERHDPSKLEIAHTVAAHFIDHQDEVFEHLSEVYHKKEGIEVSPDVIFTTSFGPSYGSEPY